jgi:hypothetical protein
MPYDRTLPVTVVPPGKQICVVEPPDSKMHISPAFGQLALEPQLS